MEVQIITWKDGEVENVRAVSDDPKYRTKIYKADGSFSRNMQWIFQSAINDAKEGKRVEIRVVK